ncbi:MAG: VWA domain-containing protein [Gemmataceae bacterium]|nr:VWA domain-containing protein [Gemmataceae bacterium]
MKRMIGPIAKHWFPAALVVLALSAIPGYILVALRLVGLDGWINKWLAENFDISYELRINEWAALFLLLLPIVLVILYFLKLKRKPLQVPSTFLWKKSIEDLHVNTLFQWLRNNVLLVLQLCALLFLIYSVLGLRFHGAVGSGKHYILLIDNSASMSATDVEPNRLEWAKREALRAIDAASDSDVGMVLVFNSKASTLQTYTNDKEKLRAAVQSIKPTERPTRIEEALALAESLANPVRSTEDSASQPTDVLEDQKRTFVQTRGTKTQVHLYSDGRFAKLSETTLAGLNARLAGNASALGNLNLRYRMAGKRETPGDTDNLAIVGLNVLRRPMQQDKIEGPAKTPEEQKKREELARQLASLQQLFAYVRAANLRAKEATANLKLDVYIDGRLAYPLQRTVRLTARKFTEGTDTSDEIDEPGEMRANDGRFVLPPIDPRQNVTLHAYLEKVGDAFPLDDQAWLALGTTRKAKILIVGRPNPVLDAFFDQEGTRKIADAERIAASDLTTDKYRKIARSGDADLVIFDRCAPDDETDMPLANTYFIDQVPPPWRRSDKKLKNPLLMPSKQQHPLLRHITTIWDARTHEAFVFDVKKDLDAKAAEQFDLPDGDAKKRNLPAIARVIETSNQASLLFTLPRGPHSDLVQTFALMNDKEELVSDWPLQTSFPLFLRNVLYTLGNVDDSVRAISVAPGEPVVLRPEAGFRAIDLTQPGNKKVQLARGERSGIVFSDTEKTGIYRYQAGDKAAPAKDGAAVAQPVRAFAVNLLDINESNIEPREAIHIGTERIATDEEKMQTREIWKWILLLAVLLLSVEWFVYQRRIAV